MKSMGKAMTQLGESANFDNKLFDEQSHAQLGTVDATKYTNSEHFILTNEYLFAATRALLLMNHLLLDVGQPVISAHYVQPCICEKHSEGEPRNGIEKQWRQAFG